MKTPWQPMFMAATAGLFAWQIYGAIWAVIAAIFMLVVVPLITAPIFYWLASRSEDVVALAKRMTTLRWAIWLIVMASISITGASVGSTLN